MQIELVDRSPARNWWKWSVLPQVRFAGVQPSQNSISGHSEAGSPLAAHNWFLERTFRFSDLRNFRFETKHLRFGRVTRVGIKEKNRQPKDRPAHFLVRYSKLRLIMHSTNMRLLLLLLLPRSSSNSLSPASQSRTAAGCLKTQQDFQTGSDVVPL